MLCRKCGQESLHGAQFCANCGEELNSSVDVLPYSWQTLIDLLASASEADSGQIAQKNHLRYFEEYFGECGLQASTIVVERHYTDRDWLEDYAAFYVRCLEKYRSRCTRLHFFKSKFSKDDLFNLVVGRPSPIDEKALTGEGEYLGFIVIKPLPNAIVGRTCLATYPRTESLERYYPVARRYEAHLLGFDLHVESLVFQEQDQVAAACATSSIWAALHSTGKLFHHPILSPIEITRNATTVVTSPRRDIPNNGLSLLQMADAVRQVGLEPELLRIRSAAELKIAVHAYLTAGIPAIMMGQLIQHMSDSDCTTRFYGDDPHTGHAVTITGYRFESDRMSTHHNFRTTSFEACRMSKLYVHDDQVGPFARMEFREQPVHITRPDGGAEPTCFTLTTEWVAPDGATHSVAFVPESLLLPLYHKIRLPFEQVVGDAAFYDAVFKQIGLQELKWDIRLVTNADLRKQLRKAPRANLDEILRLLQEPWPRFIWQISGMDNERNKVVEFLLDATDIPDGNYTLSPVAYGPQGDKLLHGLNELALSGT